MSNCFVCLEQSNNKICNVCTCVAHLKCWGEFLSSIENVLTYVSPNEIVTLLAYYIPCPQCRSNIYNIKSITRSDTKKSRKIVILIIFLDFLVYTQDIINISEEQKYKMFVDTFNTLSKHKILIKNDIFLSSIIKKVLINLNTIYYSSNLYYFKIFGEQIFI